jgi:hypothetical protein
MVFVCVKIESLRPTCGIMMDWFLSEIGGTWGLGSSRLICLRLACERRHQCFSAVRCGDSGNRDIPTTVLFLLFAADASIPLSLELMCLKICTGTFLECSKYFAQNGRNVIHDVESSISVKVQFSESMPLRCDE